MARGRGPALVVYGADMPTKITTLTSRSSAGMAIDEPTAPARLVADVADPETPQDSS